MRMLIAFLILAISKNGLTCSRPLKSNLGCQNNLSLC